VRLPPTQSAFDNDGKPSREWTEWVRNELFPNVNLDNGYGTTANRPVNGITIGSRYFDTDLGYIIHYDGTNWVNGAGSTV